MIRSAPESGVFISHNSFGVSHVVSCEACIEQRYAGGFSMLRLGFSMEPTVKSAVASNAGMLSMPCPRMLGSGCSFIYDI